MQWLKDFYSWLLSPSRWEVVLYLRIRAITQRTKTEPNLLHAWKKRIEYETTSNEPEEIQKAVQKDSKQNAQEK